MKTKTKVRAHTRSKPARTSKRRVVAVISPALAEFYFDGEAEPYSRVANGPDGSDAAVQAARALASARAQYDVFAITRRE